MDRCCEEGFHKAAETCVPDGGDKEADRDADLPVPPDTPETTPETGDATPPEEPEEEVAGPEALPDTGPDAVRDGTGPAEEENDRPPEHPWEREVLEPDALSGDASVWEAGGEDPEPTDSRKGSGGGCTAASRPLGPPLVLLVLAELLAVAFHAGRRRLGERGHRPRSCDGEPAVVEEEP